MKCKNCGNELLEGANVCGVCGTPVNNQSENNTVQTSEINNTMQTNVNNNVEQNLNNCNQVNNKQNGNNKTLIIIIAILVVIILVGGVYFFLSNKTKDIGNTKKNKTTTTTEKEKVVTKKNTVSYKGYEIAIPDGYTAEIDENRLNIKDSTNGVNYYGQIIFSQVGDYSDSNIESFKQYIGQQGITNIQVVKNTIGKYEGIKIDGSRLIETQNVFYKFNFNNINSEVSIGFSQVFLDQTKSSEYDAVAEYIIKNSKFETSSFATTDLPKFYENEFTASLK